MHADVLCFFPFQFSLVFLENVQDLHPFLLKYLTPIPTEV